MRTWFPAASDFRRLRRLLRCYRGPSGGHYGGGRRLFDLPHVRLHAGRVVLGQITFDILQIIYTGGFASISQYAIYGFIFYTLAMGLLLGSLLGIQIGALTTKVVKGMYIRGFYAITILAGFVDRLFALPRKLSQMEIVSIPVDIAKVMDLLGTIIFFAIMACFGFWVFFMFFKNLNKLRGIESPGQPGVEGA